MSFDQHPLDTSAEVLLEGGPQELPRLVRTALAAVLDGRVKIPWRGGYEHFERVVRHEASRPRFRWTMRTKIAE
jgi:hypothetical protein